MALKDAVAALGGGSTVALVVDAVAGSGQLALLLVDFVVSNVDLFLTLFTVLSGRLAPELEWLPAGALNYVVLGLAALYVVVILGRIANRWNNEN